MAVIGVVMFGAALVLISGVALTRGNAQFGNTLGDRHWEDALAVAESGVNWALAAIEADPGYHTGDTVPADVVGTSDERSWVISVADARDGAYVVSTPVGEFVIVKPENAAFVYAVGYAPSRVADTRRTRVVRSGFELVPTEITYVIQMAVLSSGDLVIEGNPSFYTGDSTGIHTNQFLTVEGSSYFDGCISASGGAAINGSATYGADCPMPGNQPLEIIPTVDPRTYWPRSTHDLCPDGSVRAGPKHGTHGDTNTGEPCTGKVLTASAKSAQFHGWWWDTLSHPGKWLQDSATPPDGVYYVHHGSAVILANSGSSTTPWRTTILVSASGACAENVEGDIFVEGHPVWDPHPDGGNLLLVAGRDILISGNPTGSGLIAAHEQIAVTGNAVMTQGSYLIEDACDTPGSPVSQNFMGGNVEVDNLGDIDTELKMWVDLLVQVAWFEVRG